MKRNLVLTVAVSVFLLLATEGALRLYQSVIRNRSIDDIRFHPTYRDYYFFGTNFKPGSGGPWQAIPRPPDQQLWLQGA